MLNSRDIVVGCKIGLLTMSYNNLCTGIKKNYVKEKQVLEPEDTCEDHPAKRSQSGREIERVNLR